jgi:hypothetical protein
MTECDLVEEYNRTPLASKPVKVPHGISHFDTLEYLRFEAQSLLQLLSHLSDRNIESTELSTAKEKIHSLILAWDSVLDTFQQDRREYESQLQALKAKHAEEVRRHEERRKELEGRVEGVENAWEEKEKLLQREIAAIRDHLEEGKEVWAAQMKLIEKSMKQQEAGKQKAETRYRDNIEDVERELDEILHEYKAKKRGKQDFGNILPSLFSQEELNMEHRKALGDSSLPDFPDLGKIPRLEGTQEGEKWDINIESEESSEVSAHLLSQTAQQLYAKLRLLQVSIARYKHDEVSSSHFSSPSNLESMEKGFLASLTSGMKSMSGSAELGKLAKNLKVDLARVGLNKSLGGDREKERKKREDTVVGLAGVVFSRSKTHEISAPGSEGIPHLPLSTFSQDHGLLHQLPKELCSPQSHDVKLEDLLRLEGSMKGGTGLGDTLELSGIPKEGERKRETVGSMSGTDLKDLLRDVPVASTPKQPDPPYIEAPSAILLQDSLSSARGHDSVLDFFQPKQPEEEAKEHIFNVSGVSDILMCDEGVGKRIHEDPAPSSTRRQGVPKLPLHLVSHHQVETKQDSPTIDLEESSVAILQEETPSQDLTKATPERETSNRKFSAHIREPDFSIDLHMPSDPPSKAPDSSSSLAFRLSSLFDLAPVSVKAEVKGRKEEGKIVGLVAEGEALLARRQKINQEEVEEQVSVVLPKLTTAAVEDSGYQPSNPKLALMYEDNPAFRPRPAPISMQRKLPLLPVKPEAAPGKFNRGLSRGRPLQLLHPNRLGTSKPVSPSSILQPGQSDVSSSRPQDSKIRSESPSLFNKFRIRRFKESERPALKLAYKLPSVLPQRPVAALHSQL